MSNNETGLMRKTKKELVEIICTKDVEIDNLKKDCDVYKNRAKKMQQECELANDQAHNIADEFAKLKKTIADERATFRHDYDDVRKSLEEANKNVVQHQAAIDELTSQKVEAENAAKCFKNERDSARNGNYVLGIVVIVIIACCIIF